MPWRPLLARFAEPVNQTPMPMIRPDRSNQTTEVFCNGEWIPSLKCAEPSIGSRMTTTDVKTESTDYC